MKRFLIRLYLRLFNYIARERKIAKDLPDSYIHTNLTAVITTGVLMWSYAIVATLCIRHPLAGIVGITASVVHLLSPLLYKRSNNYFFISNVFIAAGMIHQATFAYFTGGFDSYILIWFGILPMLSGVIAGKKGTITWSIITSTVLIVFLVLKLTGFQFPNVITHEGLIVSQVLILFGWIFISSIVIWAYVLQVEKNTDQLESSYKMNQNLINILSHDIATPLTVITSKIRKVLKTPLEDSQTLDLGKAACAAERLNDITKSVRELYLSELDKREISIQEVDIKLLLTELYDIYVDRLEQKKITFKFSIDENTKILNSNRSLILHQVLGNLLSNAIKFSPVNGEIKIQVSKKDNTLIEFRVEDAGEGIPQKMRNDIFEVKLSKSLIGTNGEVGTGLGLPIVKSCVSRLGGAISCESQTAQEGSPGTIFKIEFPSNFTD